MGPKSLALYLKAQDPYDDATLERLRHPGWEAEWPQSGSRVKGHADDAEIRRRHHGYPWEGQPERDGRPRLHLFPYRRTSVGDLWIGESRLEQGGDAARFKVTVAELKDGLVHRETSWVVEPFEAPGWRRDLSLPLTTLPAFDVGAAASPGGKPRRQILSGALDLLAEGRLESAAASLYGDEAEIEIPQSGERFVGLPTITEMLTRHPAAPRGAIVRSWDAGSLLVAETSWRYAEERWTDVALYAFRGARVIRACEYFLQ